MPRYFGHGGGEQYARSHKIRHLKKCAATMLWGCSSGALKDMGDFDRIGTPYNYMLAGWYVFYLRAESKANAETQPDVGGQSLGCDGPRYRQVLSGCV